MICGPSASGKTTLVGLIAGLDRPNSGRVELFGRPLADMSDGALALLRRIRPWLGVSGFQALAGAVAWDNVALPLVPMGVPFRGHNAAAGTRPT